MTSIGTLGAVVGGAAVTTITVTKPVPVGGVVITGHSLNSNRVLTVSDSRGNTYTTIDAPASGAPLVRAYQAMSVLTRDLRVGDEITVTLDGSSSRQVHIAAAWSGLAGSPIDKSGIANSGAGSTSASPGASGTLVQPDETLVVIVGSAQQAGETTLLPGWTLVDQIATTVGSNDRRITMWELTVSATDSVTPRASLSVATSWGAALASLALAPSEPAPSGPTFTVLESDLTRTPVNVLGVWDGAQIVPANLSIS